MSYIRNTFALGAMISIAVWAVTAQAKPDKKDGKATAKVEAKKEDSNSAKAESGAAKPNAAKAAAMPGGSKGSRDVNAQPEFTDGPGDVMLVNVWKEPEV